MSDRFQLAIESSAKRASVALGCGVEVVFEAEVEAGMRPSEVLMGPVREALECLGDNEIGLVVIGMGPGSYNGARVGIATGQGVALVHGCPAVGVCSLEALAKVREGGPCLAVGDARRGTFFALPLREGKTSGDPDLLEHGPFMERVAAAVRDGESLVTLEEPGRLQLQEELEERVELAVPSARLLLEAWAGKGEEERVELLERPPQPFYLREAHVTVPKGSGGVME